MKGKKLVFAGVLTALCILLDLAGRWAALHWQLPLWLDCFGTVIAAFVLGPVSGAAAGLAANVISGIFGQSNQLYGVTSIALGLIVGFAARRKKFETLFDTMAICSLAAVVSVALSTPLNFILRDGLTGNRWGDGVIEVLVEGRRRGRYYGRSRLEAPEIDGKVLFTAGDNLRPGDYADVFITDASEYDLIGEAVRKEC